MDEIKKDNSIINQKEMKERVGEDDDPFMEVSLTKTIADFSWLEGDCAKKESKEGPPSHVNE